MILPIITDTHFGARGDSEAMLRNQKKFLDNVFFPTLQKFGAKRVLHLGDYGDRRKYINYGTAAFIFNSYRTPMLANDIEEVVLVGNHDCYYKHSTQVNCIEELYRDDPMVTVIADPREMIFGGKDFLLLPWICESNHDASMKLIQDTKATVVMGHLELSGFQQYRGMVAHEGLDPSNFDRFSLVCSGHYHHKSQKGPVNYLGAAWPMIWSDYADPRGFHLLDTDTLELTFVENPYSLFTRILWDDAGKTDAYIKLLLDEVAAPDSPYRESYVKIVVQNKEQPGWFDQLYDALYAVGAVDVLAVDDIIVNDDNSETTAPTTDVDTLTVIHEYVESLSTSADKNELDAYLQSLYVEATDQQKSSKFV